MDVGRFIRLAQARKYPTGANPFAVTKAASPTVIDKLKRAANDFVVARKATRRVSRGTTVIAGYPWFSDWGRDTMISLPGLLLVTGKIRARPGRC